jgi:hypothetical protein
VTGDGIPIPPDATRKPKTMNNRKLLSVSLTILLAVALLALVAPAVSAQDQGDGNALASLGLADGEALSQDVQTYNSILENSDDEISTDQTLGEINISLEPAGGVVSGPGETLTGAYDIVVSGDLSNGIGSYDNIQIDITDPEVAEFTGFTEPAAQGDPQGFLSLTEIRNANGGASQDGTGPTLFLEAGLGNGAFDAPDDGQITIATAEVTAIGSVGDETSVDIRNPDDDGDTPAVQDNTDAGNEYTTNAVTGSNFEISFDMSLDFNDQEVAPDGTVEVENVESDDQPAAVIVTYENDAGDLVIAGLSTGTFSDQSVNVEIEDTGGLSSTGDEDPSGTHTAHIVPVASLSQDYEAGDIVSDETAGAIIDNEAATVTNPQILPIDGADGFGVNVGGDLSIADDYPRNQRDAFLGASSLYGPSIFDLPDDAAIPEDERFLPIATGSHVGPTGLPIQDEIYQWFDVDSDYVNNNGAVRDGTLLNFQNSTLYDAPTQLVSLGFYTQNEFAEVSNQFSLNYSEAASHGLEIDPSLSGSDLLDSTEGFDATGNLDIDIDRGNNSVDFSYDDSGVLSDDPIVQVELTFVAADPVEGLDVPGTIDYETDHKIEQNVRQAGDNDFVTDSAQENFVTFEAGATALSADAVDAGNFLGQTVSGTDLLSDIDSDAAVNGEANPGSFLVRQGQIVTLEAATPGDTINVFEVGTTTNAEGEEVYTLGNNVVGFDDTAPGRVANLNTGQLNADERYFVTFGDETDNAAVLDVRPLNLEASPETDVIGFNNQDQQFEVSVTSDDSTDNAFIETWFHFNGTQIKDVVHVERETLTGTGDRVVEINPALDLVGPGNYTTTVLHSESGVIEQFEFEIADQPVATIEEADDVNILSPDLFDVGTPSLFDRGDIVPIELELIGGNAATVTFGDLEDQNVEVHATVFDPTYDTADVANNANTEVTVYLSTYHIGQGFVENASADDLDLQPNRPSWIAPGNFVNRNHGFFTNPADASSGLVPASDLPRSQNVYATNTTSGGIDIYGGPQGGAVLSAGEEGPNGEFPGLRYDLHATGNFSPYTVLGENREDERDDVNALDIEQRSTDDFRFWTAPGDGSNELAVGDVLDTKVGDIQSLIDAGVLTELDANVNENGNVTFTDSIAEDDFVVVQAQSTGLEGVLLEGVLRNGLSVDEFLDRDEDHVYTDSFTNTTNEDLPRAIPGQPNNDLIDFEFDVIENFSSYQDRLADADPNEELVTPDRIDPDLDLESVIAGVNSDGNLAEYFFPFRVDQDLPVQTGVDTVTPSLTFDTNTTLEPRGGEQQVENTIYSNRTDRNVPRDVNPFLEHQQSRSESE